MNKSDVVAEISAIQEAASEIMSVNARDRPNIPEIDQCMLTEKISFEQMYTTKKKGQFFSLVTHQLEVLDIISSHSIACLKVRHLAVQGLKILVPPKKSKRK